MHLIFETLQTVHANFSRRFIEKKKILSVRQQVYLVKYNFSTIETQENQKWFFTTLDPTPPP